MVNCGSVVHVAGAVPIHHSRCTWSTASVHDDRLGYDTGGGKARLSHVVFAVHQVAVGNSEMILRCFLTIFTISTK